MRSSHCQRSDACGAGCGSGSRSELREVSGEITGVVGGEVVHGEGGVWVGVRDSAGGRWAGFELSPAGEGVGVGAGLVGGVLGAAEEGATAGFADDHDAGAAGVASRWGGVA